MDLDLEKYKKIDLAKYAKTPNLEKYRDDSKTGLPQVKASIDTLQEELQKVGKIAVDALNKKPTEEPVVETKTAKEELETLKGNDRLDKTAIKGLDDYDKIAHLAKQGGLSRYTVQEMIDESVSEVGATVSFETVSKNLDASGAMLNYTGDNLTSIAYANGITKTLNYTGDTLTSVVLSGSTPSGINLTKTLSYTGENLTGVVYS